MAKKVRFPLEMDNGVEVRSVEELKENFSLSRVLGYVADGKLITWLQDRYATELADEVERLDKDDDELAKKVCQIFDIPFDDGAMVELERAEERKRKLGLLKNYTECMEYSKEVELIAFDQDDLYDLLDEGAEKIYLCGKRFSVPAGKKNVEYIGILNTVTVCIDSKVPVDFAEKHITFVNCEFDSKYQELLRVEDVEEETEETMDATEEEELYEEIDASEIKDLVDDLMELLSEFAGKEYENEDDELYEYDYSIECDAGDYNDYGYETKAKAKAACKSAITSALKETKELYADAKSELVEYTRVYYRPMSDEFSDFINGEFLSSIDDLVDVYCSEETKKYVMLKKSELLRFINGNQGWLKMEETECEKQFECLVKTAFDNTDEKSINVKELFNMCEYEEDDGEYGFLVENACDYMVGIFTHIIEREVVNFPERVAAAFMEIRGNYISKVAQWIEELRR